MSENNTGKNNIGEVDKLTIIEKVNLFNQILILIFVVGLLPNLFDYFSFIYKPLFQILKIFSFIILPILLFLFQKDIIDSIASQKSKTINWIIFIGLIITIPIIFHFLLIRIY